MKLYLLKESHALKVDWFEILWKMKGNFLFRFNTCFILAVYDFLPRSDYEIGKSRLNLHGKLHLHLKMLLKMFH